MAEAARAGINFIALDRFAPPPPAPEPFLPPPLEHLSPQAKTIAGSAAGKEEAEEDVKENYAGGTNA